MVAGTQVEDGPRGAKPPAPVAIGLIINTLYLLVEGR
jgi:hypothetical protein